MKKRSLGFTLAEVLITLGIIGVVAALTIPTLVANYQKTQYVSGLKKAYSQVNQALVQMANDNGTPGDLTDFFDSTDTNTMGSKFVSYFNAVKLCPIGTSGCFPTTVYNFYDGTNLDGSGTFSTHYRFVTTDGVSFLIGQFSLNCAQSLAATGSMHKTCSPLFYVDVNGLKGPNYLGRDIYRFAITTGKGPLLYPSGGPDWSFWNGVFCSAAIPMGERCAGRIIQEAWEMNY